MEKHLYLVGPRGCGKSALLTRMLGPSLAAAGGFVIEELHGSYGELTGFALSPAAAAAGVAGFNPEPFLDCTRFPPHSDNDVFRHTGARLLEEAALYPYALLDEIGGYELLIPPFREALFKLLRSSLPILGALRTEEEADALRQALGLGDKWRGYASELRTLLENDPHCRVIDLSRHPHTAEAAVKAWVREYAL